MLCFCVQDGDHGRICIRVRNELQIHRDQLEMRSMSRPLHSISEAAKGGNQVQAKVSSVPVWTTAGRRQRTLKSYGGPRLVLG